MHFGVDGVLLDCLKTGICFEHQGAFKTVFALSLHLCGAWNRFTCEQCGRQYTTPDQSSWRHTCEHHLEVLYCQILLALV